MAITYATESEVILTHTSPLRYITMYVERFRVTWRSVTQRHAVTSDVSTRRKVKADHHIARRQLGTIEMVAQPIWSMMIRQRSIALVPVLEERNVVAGGMTDLIGIVPEAGTSLDITKHDGISQGEVLSVGMIIRTLHRDTVGTADQ